MVRATRTEWMHFASFEDDDAACSVAGDCHGRGMEVIDVFGPYPIHGIGGALGLRPSRLSWVCFAFGLTGLVLALWLQYWTSAIDWPLNVGGKPFESLPAFIPVAFELTVLLAGLGTVATFLVRARLFPGKRPTIELEGVTDDRFVVVVRGSGPDFDLSALHEIFARHGAARTWDEMTEVAA